MSDLDKILSDCDALSKRMDSLEKRRADAGGYVVKQEKGFKLLEGTGTRGGEWCVTGRGETKWFPNRRQAEDHFEGNVGAFE